MTSRMPRICWGAARMTPARYCMKIVGPDGAKASCLVGKNRELSVLRLVSPDNTSLRLRRRRQVPIPMGLILSETVPGGDAKGRPTFEVGARQTTARGRALFPSRGPWHPILQLVPTHWCSTIARPVYYGTVHYVCLFIFLTFIFRILCVAAAHDVRCENLSIFGTQWDFFC